MKALNIPAILNSVPVGLRRHLTVKLLLSVFQSSHDQWIEFNECAKAYIDLRDPEARNVFLKRSFEPDFFTTALAVLSDGDVFFDCGAHFGLCTFGLIPLIGSQQLNCHLFEANSGLIRYLKTSSSLFPAARITVTEGCISDKHGASRFHVDTGSAGKSHVAVDGKSIQRNIVLDDYLDNNEIDVINFLKMDLEGQELNALNGLSKSLHRGAIEVIYFEVRTELLHRYGLVAEDIIQFLNRYNFQVFYCRKRDLISRSRAGVTFCRPGLNRLCLAELGTLPHELGTDLLAVHDSLFVTKTIK